MRITYEDKKVERYFEDYREMAKRIPIEWVRTIKKHIDRLKSADTFGVFLKLNLGHPEPLQGNNKGKYPKYSVRITGNVRLIFRPRNGEGSIMTCKEIVMEGVVDYHGAQETWYIP